MHVSQPAGNCGRCGNTLNLASGRNASIVFRADAINGIVSDDMPQMENDLCDGNAFDGWWRKGCPSQSDDNPNNRALFAFFGRNIPGFLPGRVLIPVRPPNSRYSNLPCVLNRHTSYAAIVPVCSRPSTHCTMADVRHRTLPGPSTSGRGNWPEFIIR